MRRFIATLNDRHRQHLAALAAWEALRDEIPARTDRAAGGLTICSVGFRARRCLDLNDRLMARLNPGAERPEWLVFDNNVDVFSSRIVNYQFDQFAGLMALDQIGVTG